MNEKDQNFDQLKRLLKLKQHEVPPPGYFNNFSSDVISRIRAGEVGGRQTFLDGLRSGNPWFASFKEIFETRPGLIGGFAASLCLLLVFGVIFAEHSEQTSPDMFAISGTSTLPATSEATSVAPLSTPTLASVSLPASVPTGIVASTNPVTSLQPVATMFGQPGASTLFQPASFAPVSQ
jgi:hypothetical protein